MGGQTSSARVAAESSTSSLACEDLGPKPFPIQAISDALTDLTAIGRIRKVKHGV